MEGISNPYLIGIGGKPDGFYTKIAVRRIMEHRKAVLLGIGQKSIDKVARVTRQTSYLCGAASLVLFETMLTTNKQGDNVTVPMSVGIVVFGDQKFVDICNELTVIAGQVYDLNTPIELVVSPIIEENRREENVSNKKDAAEGTDSVGVSATTPTDNKSVPNSKPKSKRA